MTRTLASCSLVLLLGACAQAPQTGPAAPGSTAMTTSFPASLDVHTLSAYDWTLAEGRDALGRDIAALKAEAGVPMRLAFTDESIQLRGGCNTQFGSYAVDAGGLRIPQLAGTLKACAPDLMQRDAAMAGLLKGSLAGRIEGGAEAPTLVLSTGAGEVLRFAGKPTPETLTGSRGVVEFLEIAPRTVACSHPLVPDHRCLNVRERRYGDDGVLAPAAGPWHPLYETIQGYAHQDGAAAILRVKRYDWKNPPADASSRLYVLDMVVQQAR